LVLVLFALCILIAAAIRSDWFSVFPEKQPAAPAKLVWWDGSVAAGLYRAPADSVYPAGEEQADPETTPTPKSQSPGNPPARLAPLFFKPIPINQADEELLTTIPGIGPAFAKRIIEFREQQGRINDIEELDAVKGVGPAKLKILKAHLIAD